MRDLLIAGWSAFSRHSKLWFVGVLLLVLPGAFLLSFSAIYQATDANIHSVVVQRINSFQDLLTILLSSPGVTTSEVDTWLDQATEVSRTVVLREESNEYWTWYHTDTSRIGEVEANLEGFRAAVVRPGETIIFQVSVDGQRAWQAYRYLPEIETYFLTEHKFTALESLLASRWYQAYLTLTLVFVFIIALALWLVRQINFEQRYLALKDKLRERDLITEGMVHELRAPLTAMRGYASLIEEDTASSDTQREYARRISQSSGRLVDLVSDFLRAAKVHADLVNISSEPLNIHALLNRLIAQFAAEAEAKGLKLKTADQLVIKEPVFTDEKRLEQILINLISNAIKYTKSGSIEVLVEQNFRSTTFTIADTGSGMSADDQKKLFAPFVRLGDSAAQAKVTGTGLGMWLTKELVEQLRGSIGVESIKGVGTHVIVHIPNQISQEASEKSKDKL